MHSSVVRCRGHVRCSMPELKMQKCIRKPKRACSAQPQATSTCSSKIDQLRKSGRQSFGKGLLLLLLVQRVVYTLALPIFSAEKKRTCKTVKWYLEFNRGALKLAAYHFLFGDGQKINHSVNVMLSRFCCDAVATFYVAQHSFTFLAFQALKRM